MNINDLHGEELFTYLRENKKELLQTKASSLKLCDAVIGNTTIISREPKTTAVKEDSGDTPTEPGTIKVKMVANTANFVDSHMDMILPGAYKESIKARGTSIPHLLDHNQSAVGHIGDVTKVYTKVMDLKDLGFNADGTTTALLMESTVRKDYNEQAFKFYSNGKINQHSIGLSYGGLDLAINSNHESDKANKQLWDKYYPQVINKDVIDKRGYFYIVPKVDIRENSAVLFGSNSLTPTLSMKYDASLLDNEIIVDEILPLENKEEIVITQPIGNTMTLEEALGEIISLKTALETAKAEVGLAKASARLEEKQRVLDILKAQTTFGNEEALKKAALDFVAKDTDVKTATSLLEVLKGHIQSATPVSSDPQGDATFNKGDVVQGKSSFLQELDKALEKGLPTNDLKGFK